MKDNAEGRLLVDQMDVKFKTRDVQVYYGDKQAIRDVSVDILDKTVTAFIGPSGCGKATFLRANLRALPALLVPLIILGGIYSGVVTISEAAGLSAIVAILVSLIFYREIGLRDVLPVLADGVRQTGVIIFIILGALTFAHWLTGAGVTQALVAVVEKSNMNAWQFLLFANMVMFGLGMFLEVISVILIFVPLVVPVILHLGINPIHFGVVLVINMEIALLTPPVGLNLFVLQSISDAPISKVIKGVGPYIVLMLGLLVLVTFLPALSTWLPDQVFGKR